MNQKTCKRLKRIARNMAQGHGTTIVETDGKGHVRLVDAYKELKERHAALPKKDRRPR